MTLAPLLSVAVNLIVCAPKLHVFHLFWSNILAITCDPPALRVTVPLCNVVVSFKTSVYVITPPSASFTVQPSSVLYVLLEPCALLDGDTVGAEFGGRTFVNDTVQLLDALLPSITVAVMVWEP